MTGVDSAKSLFSKTHTAGLEVQKSMDALIAELNSISATITASKSVPGATQPTAEKTAAK